MGSNPTPRKQFINYFPSVAQEEEFTCKRRDLETDFMVVTGNGFKPVKK
jgi:hypothetical protein